jgi:inosine-uridine nucleoside N-ribohydrolase
MAFLKLAPSKFGLSRILILLGTITVFSGSVFAEKGAFNGPINVIFDTDMCLGDDDGMALAIVHALHDRHEANLVAVTVGLDEKWCAPYASVLNTFYGRPDVPIGTIKNGLSFKATREKISNAVPQIKRKRKRPDESFVQLILERKNPDGSPIYPHRLTDGSQAPEAVFLLRKTLADQPDDSVVMIQVGNSANFAALLDSRPDLSSDLSGLDLIKKKVRFLSVMAGTFQDMEYSGSTLSKGIGINIVEDVSSAQKIFSKWPTPIIASGGEIGEAIRIPGFSIERDFLYVSNHPISESYRYVCTLKVQADSPTANCPHDHTTFDLTATLYALRPDRNYFSLSKPGRITVLSGGNIRFDEDKNGNHRYLIVSEEQKIRTQEAMIMLISQPPVGMKYQAKTKLSSNLIQ